MDENLIQDAEPTRPSIETHQVAALLIVILVAGAIGFGYGYHESRTVNRLTAENQDLRATISQMRSQLDSLSARMTVMAMPTTEAPPSVVPKKLAKASVPASVKRSGTQDRRWKQLQAEVAENKKQLAATQQEVEKNRSDLESRLGSTRDELNGSIAKTHDELVALARRGERNYAEFDVAKSKDFQRAGPIQVSLRKADPKHQTYDLMLLVDDYRLPKKKVDLYEPIWISENEYPQPLQIVVNKIDKNHVHGYVSAPKYKASDLASNAPASQPGSSANAPANTGSQPPR